MVDRRDLVKVWGLLAVAGLAGAMLGCASAGGGPGRAPASTNQTPANAAPRNGPAPSAWMPKPVAIRIYPSTRFVLEKGAPILEARIELFDDMGDSIKSSGAIRCELYALGGRDFRTTGPLLYKWDVAMRTIDDQRRYFDPITHGYVFRLKLDDADFTRRPTQLRVVFQPIEGQRLTTQGRVQTEW